MEMNALELLVKRVDEITKVLARLTERVSGICVAMEEILSSAAEVSSPPEDPEPDLLAPEEETSRDWN